MPYTNYIHFSSTPTTRPLPWSLLPPQVVNRNHTTRRVPLDLIIVVRARWKHPHVLFIPLPTIHARSGSRSPLAVPLTQALLHPYGGRINCDFDRRILDAFVDKLFTPAAYNVGFNLVPNINGSQVLEAPDGTKFVIAVAQGNELLSKLRKMRTLVDDEDDVPSTGSPSKTTTRIHSIAYSSGKAPSDASCLTMLDLADVVKVCEGGLKQTNHLRALSLSNVEAWLGGLSFPEAHITATRQTVAHCKRWSLETLSLRLDTGQMSNSGAFIVDGLTLEGVVWNTEAGKLVLNNGGAVHLNASQICWVQEDEDATDQSNLVTLPVYLNSDCSDVMFRLEATKC
ncbi:dynein heavy chain and region D6 of dynein motor-domain-containing protein [Boletus coccyginus]|nr:dynein heavy chain and region D6 of dynein motor-domain-containing protein [Boletus coccyginus]